jgi:hypothetical protein
MWTQDFVLPALCVRRERSGPLRAQTRRTHRGAVSVRFHALVGLSGQPKTDGHSTR